MIKSTSFFLFIFSVSFFIISCTSPQLTINSYPISQSGASEELLHTVTSDNLQLASGDSLNINVWGQDALQQEVTLDSDGFIYYPLINKVKASGLTIDQLQSIVTQKLSTYYVDPKVSIVPQDLSGQRFYIIGEVNNPGRFSISAQTAIFEAVALAGGPTLDAADNVVVLRKNDNTLQVASIPLQYIVTENNIHSVTMHVQTGDVLYLPPSGIAEVERFMQRINNIINPLLGLERGIIIWPQLIEALNGESSEILVQ